MAWSFTLQGHTAEPGVEQEVAEKLAEVVEAINEVSPVSDTLRMDLLGEGTAAQVANGEGVVSPGQAAARAESALTEPAIGVDYNPPPASEPTAATPSQAYQGASS